LLLQGLLKPTLTKAALAGSYRLADQGGGLALAHGQQLGACGQYSPKGFNPGSDRARFSHRFHSQDRGERSVQMKV